MMHLLWFIPLVAGLAAMRWEKLQGIALLVALICALTGVACLVMRNRGQVLPPRGQQERDTRDVQRDLPPGPN